MNAWLVLLSLWSLGLQAQNIEEITQQKATQRKYLLEQIAAYRLYAGYLKKGYEIAQQGLSLVHTIQHKKQGDDEHHFKLLVSAHPWLDQTPLQSKQQQVEIFLKACQAQVQYLPEVQRQPYQKLIKRIESLPSVLASNDTSQRGSVYQRQKVVSSQEKTLETRQQLAQGLYAHLKQLVLITRQQQRDLKRRRNLH